MDVDSYLRRIGYGGPRELTIETLRGLMAAHRQAVPFENLDIPLGRAIDLDGGALFDKIVVRRRGGFCHEQNQLFRWLLEALGFPTMLLAVRKVTMVGGEVFTPLSHQMLLVTLAERWLVDVGFGARGARAPLRLDDLGEQDDGVSRFRIEESADGLYSLSHLFGDTWRPIYDFTLDPHQPADFDERCREQQREPYWAAQRMCTRTIPAGHVSLSGTRLITVRHGEREERELGGEAEYEAVLRDAFGIVF